MGSGLTIEKLRHARDHILSHDPRPEPQALVNWQVMVGMAATVDASIKYAQAYLSELQRLTPVEGRDHAVKTTSYFKGMP